MYGPTPEDVASAVRFLFENEAVTGQTIYVDGGRRFRSYDRDMGFHVKDRVLVKLRASR